MHNLFLNHSPWYYRILQYLVIINKSCTGTFYADCLTRTLDFCEILVCNLKMMTECRIPTDTLVKKMAGAATCPRRFNADFCFSFQEKWCSGDNRSMFPGVYT